MPQALSDLPVPEELCDYRRDSDPPPLWLPHHQGDVYSHVQVPGDSNGEHDAGDGDLAMLFLHPCTMRQGAVLKPQVTVVPVRCESPKKVLAEPERWGKRYAVMPLPDLFGSGAGTWVGDFMRLGTVSSSVLDRSRRVATLSRTGRLALQQRIVFHFTRFAPSHEGLREATAHVEAEVEMQAAWVEAACDSHGAADPAVVAQAELDFEAWLNEHDRRAALLDRRDELQRDVRAEYRRRYPGGV